MKPNFFKKIVLFTSIFGLVGCANSEVSTVSGITDQQGLVEQPIDPLKKPSLNRNLSSSAELTNKLKYSTVKSPKTNSCNTYNITIIGVKGVRDDKMSFSRIKNTIKSSCKLSGDNIVKILNAGDIQDDQLYASAACMVIKKHDGFIDNKTISIIKGNIRGDENMVVFNSCLFNYYDSGDGYVL